MYSPLEADAQAEAAPRTRPFIKWAGGKSRLLTELLSRVPQSLARYHEPFAGGAALFFELLPREAVLSDVNPELINAFEMVRTKLPELVARLQQHRYEKDYYYSIREQDRESDFPSLPAVERAARFIYLNKTCFNGLYRVNSSGHFNVPFGRYSNPTICDEGQLSACARALSGVQLLVASFDTVLTRVGRGDFVYFDPPYAPLSRTANFTSYAQDGFGEELQVSLRDVCRELDTRGVQFMLSNSHTPLVRELYAEFRIEVVQAPRAINSKADRRGPVEEVLVRNYER